MARIITTLRFEATETGVIHYVEVPTAMAEALMNATLGERLNLRDFCGRHGTYKVVDGWEGTLRVVPVGDFRRSGFAITVEA